MIIAMSGLPGVGKSTLAAALAPRFDAALLDKDQVRATIFPGSHVDYTLEQDDFCVDVMYRTAAWLVGKDPATVVMLDGCTYTRAYQVRTLRDTAAHLNQPLSIIECYCEPEIAITRLNDDLAAGRHPAENRTASLYWEFHFRAETITEPKLRIDTSKAVDECVKECLPYLVQAPAGVAAT